MDRPDHVDIHSFLLSQMYFQDSVATKEVNGQGQLQHLKIIHCLAQGHFNCMMLANTIASSKGIFKKYLCGV